MENSATSRICTYEQGDRDRDRATSFHQDSGWTSSMDDLLLFDHTSATSYHDHHNSHLLFSSSSHDDFRTATSHGGAQPSASSRPKRRKIKAVDDDLEDTATSPPHPTISSKMGWLSCKQKKKQRRMMTQAKQKGRESEEYGEVEDRIEVGFVGRDKNCTTGLKHVGLCLVPLSMALNYFG